VRTRTALILGAVIVLLLGAGAWLLLTRPGGPLPITLRGPSCDARTDAGLATLSPDQMANAATITAVGLRRGVPDDGIVVALAVALQESKLTNLDGGDRDSVGLFQQRPSQGWGTPDQLHDQRFAAGAFYASLLRVKGWQQMRVTDAAQRVQRSAYPEAYERWTGEAQVLTQALAGRVGSAVTCTLIGAPAQTGPAAAAALDQGLRLDWGDQITTFASVGAVGLVVVADDTNAGWQFAHWIVAHAAGTGVARVRFAGREWSATSGAWQDAASKETDIPATDTPETHVVAEVFGN
jgi:hypothetical protein